MLKYVDTMPSQSVYLKITLLCKCNKTRETTVSTSIYQYWQNLALGVINSKKTMPFSKEEELLCGRGKVWRHWWWSHLVHTYLERENPNDHGYVYS